MAAHTPSLGAAYPSLVYATSDPETLDGLDLVFLALPHGESQRIVPGLVGRVGVLVDLAADFRLHDPAAYARWYGEPHAAPELLDRFVYGLPELYGAGARRGHAGRRARAATRRRRRSRSPRSCGAGAGRVPTRHRRRRGQRRLGRRAGAE